jgi:uncharacterized protein (UPF0305 family)
MERQEAVEMVEKFNGLLAKLKDSLSRKMISFADADINEIVVFVKGNARFFPKKFVEELIKYLDNLVKVLWQVPGYENAEQALKVSDIRHLVTVS